MDTIDQCDQSIISNSSVSNERVMEIVLKVNRGDLYKSLEWAKSAKIAWERSQNKKFHKAGYRLICKIEELIKEKENEHST